MQTLEYRRPDTAAEAAQLLLEGGPGAHVLAGGTDIIVQARERRRQVDLLVDIKRIPEVMELTLRDDGLRVGAAVPLFSLYSDPEVSARYPALTAAAHVVGGTAIQGRATLGGNLANASPAADTVPAMAVLGATVLIAGPAGTRELPVAAVPVAPGQNLLEPGEFLLSFDFPAPPRRSGQAWQRFIPRNEMDIAVVNVGVYVELTDDVVSTARIAVGAVAPTMLVVDEAAQALIGRRPDDDAIAAAVEAVRAAARPIDDMRGTIEQRRHVAGVLAERTLRTAIAQAG